MNVLVQVAKRSYVFFPLKRLTVSWRKRRIKYLFSSFVSTIIVLSENRIRIRGHVLSERIKRYEEILKRNPRLVICETFCLSVFQKILLLAFLSITALGPNFYV